MDASLFKWVAENFGLVALAFFALIAGFIGFLTWLVRRFMIQQEALADRFQRQQEAMADVFRTEAKEERKECRERHEAAMGEISKLTEAISTMAVEVRSSFFRRDGSR